MAEEKVESGRKSTPKRDKSRDNEALENGEDEEPDFSDPEDYEDDTSDEQLLGDLLKKRPKETDGIDSVVVVDNIPQVGAERQEKLKNVIRKIFSKFGKIHTEHYPVDDSGKTKGYMFVEYQNPMEAAEAIKHVNGHKLDRIHTFAVNLFTDFDKYSEIPEDWTPPAPQEYTDHGNLRNWLLNEQCYDQMSIICDNGRKTAIYLNTHSEPTSVKERENWTETYVRWSPQGTYLATFHSKGIALWGGKQFGQMQRFSHPGVQLIDFSPCERFLVTFSPMPEQNKDGSGTQAIIVWDLRTGQKKRGFDCETTSTWPIFKWNHDGNYFARITVDTLSVYESKTFGLLDKKSLKIESLKEFAWSPTDNIISYWTPEELNTPARVMLIDIPSREVLCVKNLFTVADCKIHWQKCGDYLCVKVDRYKSKKEDKDSQIKFCGLYHNFNIFRIREKEIPVDIVEVKESISAFAWEPIGNKFAIIHGESSRINVSFYAVMEGQAGSVDLVKTLERRQANHLFWSPRGQFLVLAGLRNMNGVLEFVDTGDMTTMNQTDHFQATDVEWDPTGRYVVTAVSFWCFKVDNGFHLYNFQGRLVHKQSMDNFCQLLWRPRPSTLLTPQHLKKIKKAIRDYYPRFQLEDKMRESKASKEQIENRRLKMQEYETWREKVREIYDSERDARMELRDNIDTDELDSHVENFEDESIEFLVKVEETIIEE